ncbi:MAG: nitroreductase family protein [Candidatus Nanoarchaeia archaeon]
MVDILEFLQSRRSIRKFQNIPIPEDVVNLLLEAGRLAPSRANSQPWKFIVVTNPKLKKQLSIASYNQRVVVEASLLIVVLGIIDPRSTIPDRTTELVQAGCFDEDVKEGADHILDDWTFSELKVDAALNSAIAATHIMLAAHGLGLGSCWVKLLDDQSVLKVLEVPEGFYHTGILAIGYPAESPQARPRLPLNSMVYYEKFGQHQNKTEKGH